MIQPSTRRNLIISDVFEEKVEHYRSDEEGDG